MASSTLTRPQARAVLDRAADPLWFATHVLGWTPTPAARAAGYTHALTPDQIRVVQSVLTHRKTAVPAGHGVGKTKVAALIALWFLYTHPQSKVITTGPGALQVEHLLWREIRQAHTEARVPLGGRLLTTQLELGEDWFALGLSPQTGREAETATRFQGFHARAMLIIKDEATGVHPSIWGASEGLAMGPEDRFLAIGNPTDPTSRFKQVCESGAWHVIRLDCRQHPNVLQDTPEIVPGAVTRAYIESVVQEYGADSAYYAAHVAGQWPQQGADSLIALAWVEAAQARYPATVGALEAAGCDVARYGSDATVLYPLYADGVLGVPRVWQGQDLMSTAGACQALGAPKLAIDDTGVGGGVVDRLREQHVRALPVNFGERAAHPGKFANRRAEMYWLLREKLQAGTLALDPRDTRLAADLTNTRYGQDSAGRIKIESKDEIRRRLGRSPDHGDAAALAVWARYGRGEGLGIF